MTLDDFPGEPMNLAVLPDGRVLHTTRTGEVRIHDPKTGLNTLAATLDVYQHDEEGLQSVAVDPNFARNRWVYVYYSPPLNTPADNPETPALNEGDAPEFGTRRRLPDASRASIRLSRMKLKGDKLDLKTEQKILDVPVDRGMCCHVGGNIDFDFDGNLYLSTGDDTNPFSSDGYAPIDASPNRNPVFDARRSAGNTNDLRGKILRIRPKAGGGYTIPDGNLFREGRAKTKPEIYAMGLRNPFRFGVNRENGDVYVGDYSPDADHADPARGPAGQGRWIVIRKPANYGWPFCATHKLPYVGYDFATKTSGVPFNCKAPAQRLAAQHRPDDAARGRAAGRLVLVLGLAALPAARARRARRATAASRRWAARPTRRSAGTGPCSASPSYYEGKPLFYEWSRDYIKEIRLNDNRRPERDLPVQRVRRQPDGHGVRAGRRAVRDRVRRRLLRREPGRAALEDQLRARQPDAGRQGRGDARRRPRAADRHVLERRDGRSRPGPDSRSRGTSTATATSTRAPRTRPTPTRATAPSARR